MNPGPFALPAANRDLVLEALTQAALLYLVLDHQGVVLRASPALLEMLGRDEADIQGHAVWECMARPEEAEQARRAFAALPTGHFPPAFVDHWRTPRGERVIEWSNQVLRTPRGEPEYVVRFGMDISERERTEETLRRSEEQLELALKASNIGLWSWTIARNEVYYSPRWKAQLGYEDHEIANRFEEWETRLHPEDHPRVLTRIRQYLERPEGDYEIEFRLRHKDGGYRWIYVRADSTLDDQGRPIRLMGCHVDITARKQAEEALRDREAFLRMSQHIGRIGSWDCDLPTGQVRWSEEVYAIYGIPPEEFDGTLEGALRLIHPEDLPRARQFVETKMEAGVTGELEYRITWPSGEVRLLWVRAEGIRDQDGKLRRTVGIVMDVTERQRTEATLRQSQANLEAAMSLARLGSWELDLATGEEYWSKQMYSIHGRDPVLGPPMLGHFMNLIHPDDRPVLMSAHQVALASDRSSTLDYRTNPAHGPIRHLTCTLHRFGDKRIGGIVQDISARKQVEEALRDSEERHRLIVENMTEFIVRWLPDGTRTFVNDNYCRYFGLNPEEAVGTNFFNLVAPEHRHQVLDKVRELRPDQPMLANEHRVVLPNGEIRWNQWIERGIFDAAGQLVELQSVGQDITDRKRAEEALAASERRFRALIENSADAIGLLDGRGLVSYVSPAVTRMLGWTADELLGTDVFALNHPDEVHVQRGLFARLLQGESPIEATFRCRHRDGSYRWLEAVGSNRLDDPAIGAIVINFRDISERRRLEDALRQAQKMEALGRLAGGLAHDFNNLLTVINGHADMVLSQGGAASAWRESVDEIGKAGQRAAELTRQLLAFSRNQLLQPRVMSISGVVHGLEPMLRRLIGEDIQLMVALEPEIRPVKADPGQMEQVIVNLVVNARDAMPQGGPLTITTRNLAFDLPAHHGREWIGAGAYVTLEVRDQGHGIDAAILPQIFEPFFTTKPAGKGTGLGLATVYGIVKQSGGFIDVTSELGQGAAFIIYLPVVEAAGDPGPSTAPVDTVPGGSETILLIEDQDEVRRIAQRILAQAGYHVIAASGGEEALLASARHAGVIHLVLCDVIMPNVSGPEVIERLKQTRPDARILFMSGFMEHALLSRMAVNDRTQLLQKPFTPATLTRKVRAMLDPMT